MTYNLSSGKPVSKFAFQTQAAALQRGEEHRTPEERDEERERAVGLCRLNQVDP
jgi:hypothetical protein